MNQIYVESMSYNRRIIFFAAETGYGYWEWLEVLQAWIGEYINAKKDYYTWTRDEYFFSRVIDKKRKALILLDHERKREIIIPIALAKRLVLAKLFSANEKGEVKNF